MLNSRHESIKFTVEKEADGKLPFLDLNICRKEDNSLKFSIYRKPTSTDRYITADSHHSGAQKQAAFHSMAHRLFSIPLEKPDFEAEKAKIHEAAVVNGFDRRFVDKILRTHERKKRRANATTLQPEKEKVRRVSLPFYPRLTNTIQGSFKQHGMQAVYKSGPSLKDQLCSLKDKIPKEERSGIYEIPCKNCPAVYIGQSKRKVKVRWREHKNAVANGRTNDSSVAAHAVEYDHEIAWDKARLVKEIHRASHLDAWESMYISTTKHPLMNEGEPTIDSPLFHLTKLQIK